MDTVQPHSHDFDAASWPFDEPVNRLAFASAGVIKKGMPILLVYHDHDGDWQFLHGDVAEADECLIVCLGCAYQREPALAELAGLPVGWRARRLASGGPWTSEAYEGSEDEA